MHREQEGFPASHLRCCFLQTVQARVAIPDGLIDGDDEETVIVMAGDVRWLEEVKVGEDESAIER